ncbi:protein of unknown function [Taphrina deformans PYCC 5710]|uniref:DUF7492 domain-containing protein n=1 Tax=Taphrina deformans (strain PYCC 5710 / ATCC 11124 / CBS 356.35 / IMI 108563 / JCM 9778 / NBRC 8474) TaxID=1097556 RepID=R4XAR5_TAPDE|nr:protein of unknown function [Taphrina deformans PYCC 5710]|eukprot:CCG82908.1 protein of unknown function [Taphrina deformans PYCC 5710]
MSYTSHYPMLQIQAGKSLVANYSENGHVTKDSLAPDFKPHPGNYTWFLAANSASSPSPLSTIGQAHTIGTVIGSGNFDDGVCAEDATKGRNGPRQCQSVVQVPSNLAAGSYELIWLWNFPKVAGVVEMYSSCMDIQVSANAGAGPSDTSLAGAIDTKVALADTDGTSTSTTSAQHTTKTSTIFQTTQIFTTVPSLDTTSSPSTTSTTSPGTSSTQPSTRTTTSSPSTFTTTTLSPYTTVQQVIQEAPANPLFDSNNVDYVTELVTMTIYKKAQPTA